MVFINFTYPCRMTIYLEKVAESFKKARVPFNGFGTFPFRLAGKRKPLYKILLVQNAVHISLLLIKSG